MSASPAPPPSLQLPPNIARLGIPQLLGFMWAWGLQGALSVQCYIYYLYFPRDRLFTKLLVYGVCIWEWVQMGLVSQAAVDINVYHFGDIRSMTNYHNTWFSVVVMSAVVSCIVQWYFSWRIWILSRSKILVGVVVFLAFAQMVLGVAGGVTLAIINANAVEAAINRPIVASGLITALVVDVLIATSMTYLLLRSKSGIKRSDAIVNRLVRLVIETGALTATVAFLYVIFFMMDTHDLLFECPALILPKLYSNTLLMSLNNRAFVRGTTGKQLSDGSGSLPASVSNTLVRDDGRTGSVRHPGPQNWQPQPVHINIREERYTERDSPAHDKNLLELMPMDAGRA